MTIKRRDAIDKLDVKIKQLEARRRAELSKLTQAERKRKLSILWSWGECIEKLLIAKELDPEKLKADLIKHLPEGAKRENAINGIYEVLTSKEPVTTQENTIEIPTENNPTQTIEENNINPYKV